MSKPNSTKAILKKLNLLYANACPLIPRFVFFLFLGGGGDLELGEIGF